MTYKKASSFSSCHEAVKVCHKVIKMMFILIFTFGLVLSNGLAIECNLNGLCEGHFLGSDITAELSDCIMFCRQVKVNTKQHIRILPELILLMMCLIFYCIDSRTANGTQETKTMRFVLPLLIVLF